MMMRQSRWVKWGLPVAGLLLGISLALGIWLLLRSNNNPSLPPPAVTIETPFEVVTPVVSIAKPDLRIHLRACNNTDMPIDVRVSSAIWTSFRNDTGKTVNLTVPRDPDKPTTPFAPGCVDTHTSLPSGVIVTDFPKEGMVPGNWEICALFFVPAATDETRSVILNGCTETFELVP